MSISTYSELQTAVANWTNRTDLTSRLPEFVALAEARINTVTRLLQSEQVSTYAYTSANTTRRVALPSGFREMINLRIKADSADDTAWTDLKYMPSTDFARWYTTGGTPYRYTVRDEIELDRTVSVDHTLWMHYIKKWDLATDSTNWLLSNHPDIYLYGTLSEASAYLFNDQRAGMWEQRFVASIRAANAQDQRTRDQTELDTSEILTLHGGGSFNVLTGA